MISRIGALLRRLGTAGFDELLVDSGLDREQLSAALEFYRRRGNLCEIDRGEAGGVGRISFGDGCGSIGCRGCPLAAGRPIPGRSSDMVSSKTIVYRWVDR